MGATKFMKITIQNLYYDQLGPLRYIWSLSVSCTMFSFLFTELKLHWLSFCSDNAQLGPPSGLLHLLFFSS